VRRTAGHAEARRRGTPRGYVTASPARRGVAWTCHRLPFHRSARFSWAPVRLTKNPTAVHFDADGQATAIGIASCEPAGAGIGSRCHLAPFHRSANGSCLPELLTPFPPTVHSPA